jgi:hypothetical protein
LIKPEADVELPKMPGKIHIREGDQMRIADELVRRNVCDWIPLKSVFSVRGTKVLNGLFGVAKPTSLQDGRPILRFIMNLTGSNSTHFQLEGGCSTLPSICSWQSIVLDGHERLSLQQSDMCSAFYLFKIPGQWKRHLAFNIISPAERINRETGELFALACAVIPMGWLNSVSIMQEISENLLSRESLPLEHRLARGYTVPPWLNSILDHSRETGKSWWHVYLDDFAGGERVLPSEPATSALLCHQRAEKIWSEAGVVSSAKKRVSGAELITELGAEVGGAQGTLGVSTTKLVSLIQATLWMAAQKYLDRKTVQVIAGRCIFALQFRRPVRTFLQRTWGFISGGVKMGQSVREQIKAEFLSLVFTAPLLHCNLAASVCPQLVSTDASESGGSVDFMQKV